MRDLGFFTRVLPAGWKVAHIAEVTSKVGSGATPRGGANVYVDEGAAFIRSQNVHDHEFRSEGIARLTAEAAHQLRGVAVAPNDVLINITGDSILRTCTAPTNALPAHVSQHVAIVRSNGRVDARFLQKWFALPAMKDFMIGHSSGGTRKAITKAHLLSFPLPLPPIEEQRGIAATLGALDDKIESNRRQLLLLDALFQTEWSQIASVATGRRRLSDVVSTQYGLTASAGDLVGGTKFLRVTDINKQNWVNWRDVPTVDIDDTEQAKYGLHVGDLLVARMADPGKSAIYDDETVDAVFASYLVRLRASSLAESLYVYGFLKSRLYSDYASGAMTGSVQKNMNAKVIVAVELPWPSRTTIDAFAQVAIPLRSKINQCVREIQSCERLRDGLVPELLSGRIRVPEAADVVQDGVV